MSESTTDLTGHVNTLKAQLDEFDAANASLCTYWPIAKTVLGVLEGLATSYPTIEQLIEGLIAAGDKICSSDEGAAQEAAAQQG
jgi:hypothetical protein